jgi:hypothetical protein
MNETRACKTCGAEFQPLAPGRKYCGSKCRPSGYSPQQQKGGRYRIGKLDSIGSVSSELAKLYRRVAHGHIDSSDGSRMAGILGVLRQALEVGMMEVRLLAMEDQIMRLAATKAMPILLKGLLKGPLTPRTGKTSEPELPGEVEPEISLRRPTY